MHFCAQEAQLLLMVLGPVGIALRMLWLKLKTSNPAKSDCPCGHEGSETHN